jgi:hypothetical protein
LTFDRSIGSDILDLWGEQILRALESSHQPQGVTVDWLAPAGIRTGFRPTEWVESRCFRPTEWVELFRGPFGDAERLLARLKKGNIPTWWTRLEVARGIDEVVISVPTQLEVEVKDLLDKDESGQV